MPGAGALLQRFYCCLQSCLMSLCVQAVARQASSFSDVLLFFRPGLPEVPPTDAWVVPPVHRRLRALCYQKLCCRRLCSLLGAVVESADGREEACEIRDGRCKPETRLFAGWVSLQGERAVRRAVESEKGGKSFQTEVIGCSWPRFLFEHLPVAGKKRISLCDVAWGKTAEGENYCCVSG